MAEGIVSGGGVTAVAPEELLVEAQRLAAATLHIVAWRGRLAQISNTLMGFDDTRCVALGAESAVTQEISSAIALLTEAENQATKLRSALVSSAECYGMTERLLSTVIGEISRFVAWGLGASAPGWLPPVVIGAWALQQFGVRNVSGDATQKGTALGDIEKMLAIPAVAKSVAFAGDSFDEFVAGLLGIPVAMAMTAGSGWHTSESAASILGLLAHGAPNGRLLIEREVTVRQAKPSYTVAAPNTLAQIASRIPEGKDSGAQIRIERYDARGRLANSESGGAARPRWIVYVAGTMNPSVVAGNQPADMTNNVANIASFSPLDAERSGEHDGALLRAVRDAMTAAGVQSGDEVLPVGYSGGGIIAASLAGDPNINTPAAFTLGSPVSSADLGGTATLSLRHNEDLVPWSGGVGKESPERVDYRRDALAAGDDPHGFAAHRLAEYTETAAQVDQAEEFRLVNLRDRILKFAGTDQATVSLWVAERVPTKPLGGAAGER